MPDEPRVSVIIPVRDRRDLLARTLHALDEQKFLDFEVVVVDDGSTDGTSEAAQRIVAGAPVRVLTNAGRGAVAARWTGVAAARGDVFAFTDSDCEPSPAWLEAAIAAIDAGADLAHGPTEPTRPPRPLERTLWSNHEGLYPSANLVVRRDAYEKAGGFESRGEGRDHHGADTLFAWRVRRAGVVTFAPDALVRHAVLPFEARDAIQRQWQVSAFPRLVKEVPELRGTILFRYGVSLGKYNRLPLYAVAAATITGRRRLAAVGAAWWVRAKLRELEDREGSLGARVRALPVELALDVITAAGLFVGSVKSRNLVI